MSSTTVPTCAPARNHLAVKAPQYLTALDRANVVRLRRAEVKRQLDAGTTTLADAMGEEACRSMKVCELLAALPRYGTTRVEKALIGICWPNRCVGDLTDRQRGLVLAVIAGDLVYDHAGRQHRPALN